MIHEQEYYCKKRLIHPWMIRYPLIVQAAFTWFDYMVEKKMEADRKRAEESNDNDPNAAQPPSMKGHKEVVRGAHRIAPGHTPNMSRS